MISLSSFRCFAAALAFAAFLAAAPASAKAQAAQSAGERGPTALELSGLTASGSYLAARHAGQQRDASSAAAYYRNALKRDPKNVELLDRAFLSFLVGGNIDEAVKLAEPVASADKSDRVAHLVLGVNALKQAKYPIARRELAQSIRGPITDLTATLLSAWSLTGSGDNKGAVAAIDKLAGPDWYAIFKDLHAGMILELAGNKAEAGKRFERAYKLDSSALRVVEAYGSWVSRNKSVPEALAVFEAFDKVLPRHPLVVQAMNKLKAGEKLTPLVATAQAGAAEALYGLGASLGRRGGEDLGLVYLQLSLHLSPNHALALLSLADLYESLKKPEMALAVYQRIPANSPLHRNAAIQMAANLDALERADEAEKQLASIIAQDPKDLEAVTALGNIQRGHKKFAECADTYSKAHRSRCQARKVELGQLLFPRHLLRALQAMGEGGSRSEKSARSVSRTAARPQLSRLFVDRSGHQSRRRHGDDQEGRAAAPGRRLHRRFARLGLLPARQLRGRRQAA